MLYFKCPTCRTVLANKQLLLEEAIGKICQNRDLSNKEKDEQKMNILDKFEIKRYCCRMRALTYVQSINIIK